MSRLSPEQEMGIVKALLALGPLPYRETLRVESIRTIQEMHGCSHGEAEAILDALERANLIEADFTRGGELDARKPMPTATWFWVVPKP